MDIPVLHDFAFAVGICGAGVTMAARYLSAVRILFCPGRADRLLQDMRAVDRIDSTIAVAVENDQGDRRPSQTSLACGTPHGGERRGQR